MSFYLILLHNYFVINLCFYPLNVTFIVIHKEKQKTILSCKVPFFF